MEQVLVCLEQLLLTKPTHKDKSALLIEEFYSTFSKLSVSNQEEGKYFQEYGFPKIHLLLQGKVLKKDILYLYVVVNKNWDLLYKCIEYEKSVFELNLKDASSLFDYMIFFKQHWFEVLLQKNDIGKGLLCDDIYCKLLILKLTDLSHLSQIELNNIKCLVNQIDIKSLDDIWTYYIEEIKYLVNIVEFCNSVTSNVYNTEIFTFANCNSMLETFSKFLDLDKLNFEQVTKHLCENERHNAESKKQKDTFILFSILVNIFNIVLPINTKAKVTANITEITSNIKSKILSIKDHNVQVQLLENIFTIMFIKNTHLLEPESTSDKFLCSEKEIQFILFLLSSILEEIKLNNVYTIGSPEYDKLQSLNKHIADAKWRLEIIVNVKKPERCSKNLMPYMLAPSESLLQMCLKRGDFSRAYQVIKLYGLKDSKLASDIDYCERLQELKSSLKQIFRIKSIHKQNPNINVENMEIDVNKTVQNFFKNNPPRIHEEYDKILDTFSKEYSFLSQFNTQNELFMNIFDLAINLPNSYDDTEALIQIAFEYNTLNEDSPNHLSLFSKKVLEVFKAIGTTHQLTISEILTEPSFSLNLTRYKEEHHFYDILTQLFDEFNTCLNTKDTGILNPKHLTHKCILNLNKVCNDFVEWRNGSKDNVKYLSKLFNYLKAFSKVLYIEQNTSDIVSKGTNTSYFELLQYNRAELMGKLLFEKNLDPSEFEKYFNKMKLDYLYHIAGNCFPTVNLHTDETVTKDELYPENNLYIPSKAVITYIQKRNWLLALILNEMFKVDGVEIGISQSRVMTFFNYMNLKEIQNLKVVFENNGIITALQNDISYQKIADYFNTQILKHDLLISSVSSNHSSDSFETGEEIEEDALKTTNWKALLDIIDSIPEAQRRKNSEFVDLKDMVLVNIVHDGFEFEYYKYVQYIENRDTRIIVIMDNLKRWPGKFCIDVIKSELSRANREVIDGKITELKVWLSRVELCEKLMDIIELPTWAKIYEKCLTNSEIIISNVLVTDRVNLLIEYLKLYPVNEDVLLKIDEQYVLKIFESDAQLETIKTLLDIFPVTHAVNICHSLLKSLKQLEHLQFVADYVVRLVPNNSLKNVQMSLKILSAIAQSEQEQQFLCLLHEPLSIIEILIMNTKLNQLGNVLDAIKGDLPNTEFDESMISVEKVDKLLRSYAEKSLDFRVITQPNPRLLRTPECKLMQSLDSLNIGSDSKGFVMPDEVPIKDDWVQNHEVLECMCCLNIIFSMFNRRHHCRRCGRVVCYNCSTKRMLVPTYGDILVRVCTDCYEQTHGENASEFNENVSIKSALCDCWLLTDDPEHNEIVRGEFSYEYAPSVSLCLSLMKYHSKNEEYTRFLLDQCDILLKLIQPSQEPLQEIDYLLVIKMLKSLAVAAKLSTTECVVHYGTSLADRILSQSELIGLLAERGCLNLLPVTGSNQSPYIDAAVLRRLRDRLLEREQWNLALEVSTKAGMDNIGVFVAWGKSCLKAGSLLMAREKFGRCFDKSSHYDSTSDFTLSEADDSSDTLVRSRNLSKSRTSVSDGNVKPSKNPPLLNEIIHILESKTESIDTTLLGDDNSGPTLSCLTTSITHSFTLSSQPDAAVCILNKLRRLKNISAGNYDKEKPTKATFSIAKSNRPKMDAVFYEECVFYLSKYGTHISLLEFFIKHGDLERALTYIADRKLSTDVFIDIYLRCLKEGIVDTLQAHMSKIDSTLDVWKEYLTQICCHLEKQHLLHSLYQLQLFIGDYIRAAITCIRFYEDNITNFTDLNNNSSYLQRAEEHLKQVLEQEQWVEVASVKSSTSKEDFEEKGLANPSLVMRIKIKDIDKHINTIAMQNEVTKFVAQCESLDKKPMQVLSEMVKNGSETIVQKEKKIKIPTLFGSSTDKRNLTVLLILCGETIEQGFEVALKVINEFKLKPLKVFNETGKQLARMERYSDIAELVSCIKKSGTNDKYVTDVCDEMLMLAIATLTKANIQGTKIEDLIKLISDRASKISAYIEVKQLKTAYFLAVKYKRMSDIRRILREAELLNQPNIKILCQKVLQSHSHSPVHTKD